MDKIQMDTEQIQTAKRFKIVKSEEEAKDAIKTNPPPPTHTHTCQRPDIETEREKGTQKDRLTEEGPCPV